MDSIHAIQVLQRLFESRGELIKAYERKRSWSGSERAMAVAKVVEDRNALIFAIDALKEEAK